MASRDGAFLIYLKTAAHAEARGRLARTRPNRPLATAPLPCYRPPPTQNGPSIRPRNALPRGPSFFIGRRRRLYMACRRGEGVGDGGDRERQIRRGADLR